MATAMAELTHQNQELRREINLRRQTHEEREGGGQTQSHDDRENAEIGSQLRGTTSRTVPHLKEEMDQMKKVMEEMKENMRRVNPVEIWSIELIPPLRLPSRVTLYHQSSSCLLWIRIMGHKTLLITLPPLRPLCIFKGFPMK